MFLSFLILTGRSARFIGILMPRMYPPPSSSELDRHLILRKTLVALTESRQYGVRHGLPRTRALGRRGGLAGRSDDGPGGRDCRTALTPRRGARLCSAPPET